jgi:hypothetical protein
MCTQFNICSRQNLQDTCHEKTEFWKWTQLVRSKMTVVFCYYEIWYYRKKFWWHKLNSNISFSFLIYWTYTLLLLLRSRFIDDITDCANEGNLHAAADGKQMIPEFLFWRHGSWVIYHKHFTTVNISEAKHCVINGIWNTTPIKLK